MYCPESSVLSPETPLSVTARLHDPELRVLHHEAGGVLGDLRLHQHLGIILGELDRRHLADGHVLVLDEGLAGLDALGRLEDDGDGRSLAQHALDRDPDGHHRGEDRDDPDHGNPQALSAHDASPAAVR